MNTCKACNVAIPEDAVYCEKCLSDQVKRDSELYLHNLDELMKIDNQDTLDEINGFFQMDDHTKKGVDGMDKDNFNGSEIDDFRSKEEEQDILDILNAINMNESQDNKEKENVEKQDFPELEFDDIFAIDDSYDSENYESNMPQDVGDIFSDALSAVTNLEDMEQVDIHLEEELLKLIPEMDMSHSISEENKDKNGDKKKKTKTSLQDKEKKKHFLKSIFSNVKEERTEDEIDRLKQEAIETVEVKSKLEEEKTNRKKQEQEDKKKKAIEKTANKKAAKLAAAKKKEEKAKAKKEAKTKKELELESLLDEIEENEGRINRVGASIVFVLFAICAVIIVIGTNIYTYTISIRDASKYFNAQKYNDAYYNVYGINIKDEDIELYDKIMTVMFVNKQLNSYNHYYQIEQYPEALDSLLKGLERYDKYIDLAKQLGIENDLNYVREKIVKELEHVFQLSEKDSKKLIGIKDQNEYSIKIYDVVSKRLGTTLTRE